MKHWKELALGLFILGAAAVLAYMSLTIGKIQLGDTLKVEAVFKNASGIVKDAPVLLAGIEIGHVESLQVVNNGNALMKMVIEPDVKVHSDARAEIRSKSLLGEKYINLIPGSDAAPVLQDGQKIQETMTPVDLDEVLNHLAPVLTKLNPDDVNDLVHTLAVSIKGREKQIGKMIDGTSILIDTIAENRSALGRMIQNLDGAASKANALLARNGASIDSMIANLTLTSESLSQDAPELLDNFKALSSDVQQITGPFAQKSTLFAERLDRITDGVDNLTSQLNTHPNLVANLDATLAKLPSMLSKAPDSLDKLDLVLDQLSPVLVGANDLLPQIKQSLKNLDPVLLKADNLLNEDKIRQVLQEEGVQVNIKEVKLW